jgi:hypothetical protein
MSSDKDLVMGQRTKGSHRIAECAGARPRTVVLCAVNANVVESSDSSLGPHHFCRLVIRWKYHVENFFGMVRLGCMQILFRNL